VYWRTNNIASLGIVGARQHMAMLHTNNGDGGNNTEMAMKV
jgi:hypothetical protein